MTSTPTPAPSAPSAPALDRFFATLRRSPVQRSRNGAVAGVCAGLAERLGISVKVVRLLTVVAAVLGPALVLYLAAWLLLPDTDGRLRLEGALRQGETSSVLLLVVTVLAVVPDAGVHSRTGWLLPLTALGAVGWYLWHRRTAGGTTAPQTPSMFTKPGSEGPQDAPGH